MFGGEVVAIRKRGGRRGLVQFSGRRLKGHVLGLLLFRHRVYRIGSYGTRRRILRLVRGVTPLNGR